MDEHRWSFVAGAVVVASILWAVHVMTRPRGWPVAAAALAISVGLVLFFALR